MAMNTLFVKWVIFLTLIKNFQYCQETRFTLKNKALTAMEGSCIAIECKPEGLLSVYKDAYWFWMKDANWAKETDFFGTTVFSSDDTNRPVDSEFKNRVNYIRSTRSGKNISSDLCDIMICDLRKTDSGLYMFRYVRNKYKWRTDSLNLTIQENPCRITFSQPPPVTEKATVTLMCSTSTSCNSNPQIDNPKRGSERRQEKNETTKSSSINYTASWTDDGTVFSCQTPENTDKHLIRNITLNVEYAPRQVKASVTPYIHNIKEGDSLTLTCSAKGQPKVTFSWFKNDRPIKEGQLQFPSIKTSDNGLYYCQAKNKLGTASSTTFNINVLYPPTVNIQIKYPTRNSNHIEEGDRVTLVCNVERSNPEPAQFTWEKDGKTVWKNNMEYVFHSVRPEESGSYQCTATNSVGSGTSNSLQLQVLYKPQRTKISISATDGRVRVNGHLTFTCETEADPEPWFSWYRYKLSGPKNWTPLKLGRFITLETVQRTDEGCYICNASNWIGNGNISSPLCIQVLFPPTNVSLSVVSKVKEGQSVTIICKAESFPSSTLELIRSTTEASSTSEHLFSQAANEQNFFAHTFNATSAHAGLYTCVASNSEGSSRSPQRKLEVEYSPKDVRIVASPGTEVKENASFTLDCSAHSNPPITQFRWITGIINKKEITVSTERIHTVKSAKPSDSGTYRCEVQNVIGSGKSHVEIKIKYAPRKTTISKGEERQDSKGRASVTLSCSSLCYPPAEYVWYNKTINTKVSEMQNLTVNSLQAGEYYCIAKNEMGHIKSDSVRLFDDTVVRIMKVFGWVCLILLIMVLIILYRHRMKRTNPQRTTNRWSCCSFLLTAQGFRSLRKRSERRNTRNENIFTAASRSRDDLLPEQRGRVNAQHQQPGPDVTSSTHHLNVVYSTVNLPCGKQAPSAQRPGKSQQVCVEDDSLNYASLHFHNKKKEVDSVYSEVCKPTLCKQQAQEKLEDYENVNIKPPPKVPYASDDDTETSDEDEINYAQVNIIPNPSAQSDTTDSSTSEDETQYSQVKL